MRLLGNDLNLIELKLDRGLAAKHGNNHTDRVLFDLNTLNRTGEGTQRTVKDAYGIADFVVDDDLTLLNAHLIDFVIGQGGGVVAGCSNEAGDSADIPDHMPCVITVDHFDQHITGVDLTVVGFADTGLGDFRNSFLRDGNGQNLFLEATAFNGLFNGSFYSVLIAGVGMDYIPLCSISHSLHLT